MSMIEINGIGGFPSDVIIEILSKLSLKNLGKFKCVSKQWLNLISRDPCFLTQHRQLSKKNPILFFRKYTICNTKEEEVAEAENRPRVMLELTSIDMENTQLKKIRAPISDSINTFTSCEQLVLIQCISRLDLCNPATGELACLPRSSHSGTYCSIGFGYIRARNEYKIVHSFFNDSNLGENEMGCEVLTLRDGEIVESGSWRRINNCCPYRISTDCPSLCVSGMIYWMIDEETTGLRRNPIVSFDMEREEFGIVQCPNWKFEPDPSLIFLTGFKGSLCLVDCCSRSRSSAMDIWVLKNHTNSSWVKECSVSLFPLDDNSEIRCLIPSNDQIGVILILSERQGLVCYNIDDGSVKIIENHHIADWYKPPCLYYESFFFPRC